MNSSFWLALSLSLVAQAGLYARQQTRASSEDESRQTMEQARSKRLDLMRDRAAAAAVTVKRDKTVQATLATAPIMRYDDQPRRCIDATLWLWTVNNRPVAVCKVEDARPDDGDPLWVTCLSSLSESLIDVDWQSGQRW